MTRMLVRRHSTRIDCVANALIVKKTLDGQEASTSSSGEALLT